MTVPVVVQSAAGAAVAVANVRTGPHLGLLGQVLQAENRQIECGGREMHIVFLVIRRRVPVKVELGSRRRPGWCWWPRGREAEATEAGWADASHNGRRVFGVLNTSVEIHVEIHVVVVKRIGGRCGREEVCERVLVDVG